MNSKDFKLSIVIPVYNSEQTIGLLVDRLVEILKDYIFEIILVNDYSQDNSHEVCRQKCETFPEIVRYLKLSKNFGEHNAVMAGLDHAVEDYAIIMDDDFQNPPEEVIKIITHMQKNKIDVLYTYYDEKEHNWFRKLGSWFNNLVSTILLDKPKDLYLCSFKCLNRFLIDEIIKYRGPYPYIDGLILRTTRNIGKIMVQHDQRGKGKSNYNLVKLVGLWLNMFINFSNIPLRLIFFIGLSLTVLGFVMILHFMIQMLFLDPHGIWPAGWPSLIVCVVTFSGAQLVSLGLIGEYLGKLYLTENKTPQYIVRERYGDFLNSED